MNETIRENSTWSILYSTKTATLMNILYKNSNYEYRSLLYKNSNFKEPPVHSVLLSNFIGQLK